MLGGKSRNEGRGTVKPNFDTPRRPTHSSVQGAQDSIKHEDYVKSKTKHEKFKPIPFHDTKEVCPRGRGDASK